MSDPTPSVMWFRRDLRVTDLPALRAAAQSGPVLCVWIHDPDIADRRHHQAPARLAFLAAGLNALDAALREIGGSLVRRRGDPATVLSALCHEHGAKAVHITREISPRGRRRDRRVAEALEENGVRLHAHGGDLVGEIDDLPGSKGHGYLVFTPFYTAWRELPLADHRPAPEISGISADSEDLELPQGDPLIPAGPEAAREAIVRFIRSGRADGYGDGRNDLAGDLTSHLSAYLRFGMCSASQIGRALGLPDELSSGRAAFWRQICWREFYHHHLARNPHVARTALRENLRDVEWDDDPDLLAAWTQGCTGYPLVDAGMRQLEHTGWMHNRARMITASFLVKDLLIDWRIGETHFMQKLLDGDPANNNGGWQWTAGTGTDAAPYFRVFSPSRQAERFDAGGDYIRRWVPELAEVPDTRIHEPWTMTEDEQATARCVIGDDYPAPIVDHKRRRVEAIERYKAASD